MARHHQRKSSPGRTFAAFALSVLMIMGTTPFPTVALAGAVASDEGVAPAQTDAAGADPAKPEDLQGVVDSAIEAEEAATAEEAQETPDPLAQAGEALEQAAENADEQAAAAEPQAADSTQRTTTSASYIDQNGAAQTVAATQVTAGDTVWNSGWYIVSGNVTVNGRVSTSGDVRLILSDGASLTAKKGIAVTKGNGLAVFGQSAQTGKLAIPYVDDYYAAIGGNSNIGARDAGTIAVHGGVLDVKGGYQGAGIGGASGGSGTSISVTGGSVTARGGGSRNYGGSGIGGGASTSSSGLTISPTDVTTAGTVTISGGTVNATGGGGAAGIGGGIMGTGGPITISGGSVTATGDTSSGQSFGGAGIGAGAGGDWDPTGMVSNAHTYSGKIAITGGTVTATGSKSGAGIGCGREGEGWDVTVSGGTVTATGGESSLGQPVAGIGGGERSVGFLTDLLQNENYGGMQPTTQNKLPVLSSTVNVSGGTVTATGKGPTADKTVGIGGGYREGNNGAVSISDQALVKANGIGTVKFTEAGQSGRTLTAYQSVAITGSPVVVSSGPVYESKYLPWEGGVVFWGDGTKMTAGKVGCPNASPQNPSLVTTVTPTHSFEVPAGVTLTVPLRTDTFGSDTSTSKAELVIPAGVTVTNNGTIDVQGTLDHTAGTLTGSGKITGSGTVIPSTGGGSGGGGTVVPPVTVTPLDAPSDVRWEVQGHTLNGVPAPANTVEGVWNDVASAGDYGVMLRCNGKDTGADLLGSADPFFELKVTHPGEYTFEVCAMPADDTVNSMSPSTDSASAPAGTLETVSFDLDGGAFVDSTCPTVIPVVKNDTVVDPGTPVKQGFTFVGWKHADGSSYTPATDRVTKPFSVTAQWKANTPAAATKIDVPSAVGGLVYNGGQQTGVKTGTGYTVTGNTATNAGTYTATVTLASGYEWKDGSKDSKTVQWSIGQADFGKVSLPSSLSATYTGSAITPAVSATFNKQALKAGADYTVSGSGTAAGSYKVTVSPRGNFAGSARDVAFKINPLPLNSKGKAVATGSYSWNGSAQTPAVRVTAQGYPKTLAAGTDYTVIGSASAVGSHTVTVRGKGNFSGDLKVTFTIAKGRAGWLSVGGQRRWSTGSSWGSGWLTTGGQTYWLRGEGNRWGPAGSVATGWLDEGSQRYFLRRSDNQWGPKGSMGVGWLKEDGSWYFFRRDGSPYGPRGSMGRGWLADGGKWYFFDRSTGRMATGWVADGGSWYYLDGSGKMLTGWYRVGRDWYWSDASGRMASDRWVGDYYLTGSGAMATSRWVGRYWVDASGRWTRTR